MNNRICNENILITKENSKVMKEKLKNITKIRGSLSIYSDINLNNLKIVEDRLYIHSNLKVKLNNLKNVGDYLYIHSETKANLNNLKSVGEMLYINPNVKTNLKSLKNVGGSFYIYSKLNKKTLDRLYNCNKKNIWYVEQFNTDSGRIINNDDLKFIGEKLK